jgi:hypothetical protein
MWRNKPLLRREGDKIFKTGQEAVQLLNSEAVRKDAVPNTIDLPNFMDKLTCYAYLGRIRVPRLLEIYDEQFECSVREDAEVCLDHEAGV